MGELHKRGWTPRARYFLRLGCEDRRLLGSVEWVVRRMSRSCAGTRCLPEFR